MFIPIKNGLIRFSITYKLKKALLSFNIRRAFLISHASKSIIYIGHYEESYFTLKRTSKYNYNNV